MEATGRERFLFDEKLAKTLFAVKSRKSAWTIEIDESDDCELIQQDEGVSDDQFDENNNDTVTTNILHSIISADLPDNSGTVNFDLENSGYVKVTNEAGQFRVIKKSAIVWFLENYVRKLSSDRNLRVMQGATYQDRQNNVVKNVEKRSIRMADWCVFKSSDKESKYLIGRIISLCRLDGKKTEGSKFVWEWNGEENVGALCIWYSFEKRENIFTGRLLKLLFLVMDFILVNIMFVVSHLQNLKMKMIFGYPTLN